MAEEHSLLITAEDLRSKLQDPRTIILDCCSYLDDPARGRKEFVIGHIKGAVYMDLKHDLSSPVIQGVTGRHPLPHADVLIYTLRAAGLENNSHVIAYDQSNGVYASRMWWLLQWLGHRRTSVLNGGLAAWRAIDGILDNQWNLPGPGAFISNIDDTLLIRRDEVRRSKTTIVDSRDYKRYTGEFEPIDPVAGHIPGAVCLPYLENISTDGKWKSKNELDKRFANIETFSDNPVFYCGSGVTACHNILAYKIATGKDARLYAGSWSEWIHYYPPAHG